MLLPWLICFLSVLRDLLGLDDAPAARLALFHTVFNVLGVVLIWPLAAHLTLFLEAHFKSVEEDEARPRHLDKTVLAVPALGLTALQHEVRRLGGIALNTVRAASEAPAGPALDHHKLVVARINLAIADFVTQLHATGMSAASAHRLPEILRVACYYETATELAVEASAAMGEIADGQSSPEATAFADTALALRGQSDPAGTVADADLEAAASQMESAYQALKACLLAAGAQGRLPVNAMERTCLPPARCAVP